jgi:hypothetical protein
MQGRHTERESRTHGAATYKKKNEATLARLQGKFFEAPAYMRAFVSFDLFKDP